MPNETDRNINELVELWRNLPKEKQQDGQEVRRLLPEDMEFKYVDKFYRVIEDLGYMGKRIHASVDTHKSIARLLFGGYIK